jgi:hypothetical protein
MSSSSNLLENPAAASHSQAATKGPLFLVGIWRSGTSLLYTLMNQHPEIALLYEADLPMLRPLFFLGRHKAEWLARWDFWNDSLKRHRIAVENIEPQSATVQGATAAAYREFAVSRGADVWGEKSPNWFDRLSSVAKDFPDARFIAIWRNPADICRSVARAVVQDEWFDKRGMMLRCLLGCEAYKVECDRLLAKGVPLHQIRYDDLVRDPEATMRGICQFLDIPFDPRMATLEGADRSTIDQAPQHELVRSNQIVANKERKEVLSPELKLKIERYMRLWKKKYGEGWLLLQGRNLEPGNLPGAWEQFKDRALYRLFRKFDSMVVMIYSFAPLWLLKAYRASKRNPDVAAAKA